MSALVAIARAYRDRSLIEAHPDCEILKAWECRNRASALYEALPTSDLDEDTPEERAYREEMDAAEEIIRAATASTPRGAAIQLFVSMAYSGDCGKTAIGNAIEAEDLGFLTSIEDSFDWQTRLTLACLRSLSAMEG